MYARSTTIYGDPANIEQGIAFVQDEVWPAVQQMEGCLGMSMIIDRAAGRGITTSAWESMEAMRRSTGSVAPLREQAATITGAAMPDVAEWEIAALHRHHHTSPGTCVRAAWSKVAPHQADGAIEFFKVALLPEIEAMDGFVSASLLVDRALGRGVTSVAFDSREAMERTRDQADYMRGRSTQDAGVEFLDVAEFELVFAHLHVPELV
jgi:heme-degrading monooxygenase HmoA